MKLHANIIFSLIIFFSALSCSLSMETDLEDFDEEMISSSESGSITLGLSYISNVLEEYLNSDSRALLYATSARIEITDQYDREIIAPISLELTPDDISNDNSIELFNIDGIVSGSGYTISVEIFNSAYSSTEPVVAGETYPVGVKTDQNTTVSVICLPYSPIPIAADDGPWSAEIDVNEEVWYKIPFTDGRTYTITQSSENMGTFLYDFEGKYIATIDNTSSFTYECISSFAGDYYIGVTPTASGTSSLNITSISESGPEGTISSPKILMVDEPQILHLSYFTDSYYSFGTTVAGEYILDILTESYVSHYRTIQLFSDSDFTTEVETVNYGLSEGKYGQLFGTLEANTIYYLKMHSQSFPHPRIVIASPYYAAAHSENEGAPGDPVELTLGVPHSSTVGYHIFDAESYYTVTTGSTDNYKLKIYGHSTLIPTDLDVTYWSDSNFTTRIDSIPMIGGSIGSPKIYSLSSNTTYYLKFKNSPSLYMSKSLCQEFTILVE